MIWRKSSRSGSGDNDACVEVAFSGPRVAIRDSKNPTTRFTVPANAFSALLREASVAP